MAGFTDADASQQWFEAVLANHREEARSRASTLVEAGERTDYGCIETPTLDARRVRFTGRQMPAYRVVFCILNDVAATGVAAGYDDVVRHRSKTGTVSIPHIWSWDHAERTCRMRATSLPTG